MFVTVDVVSSGDAETIECAWMTVSEDGTLDLMDEESTIEWSYTPGNWTRVEVTP